MLTVPCYSFKVYLPGLSRRAHPSFFESLRDCAYSSSYPYILGRGPAIGDFLVLQSLIECCTIYVLVNLLESLELLEEDSLVHFQAQAAAGLLSPNALDLVVDSIIV